MVSPGNVIAQSMLDRSRIALCMFMLAIFAFNPFGAFLSQADSAVGKFTRPGGRAILEAGTLILITKKGNFVNDQTLY